MGTMDELDVAAARVDLAAAFRLAVRLDLHEGVCNHFSYMIPGQMRDGVRFLLNRYGLHWSEVSASNLLMLDAEGRVLQGGGEFEKTAFYIHSRIHLANPAAACVCPKFDLMLPTQSGCSGECASPYVAKRACASMGSPSVVPVPCASTISISTAESPALFSAW